MGTITSLITRLTIVYSTVYSDADQRKHQSSASLAFVWGIHRGPVNSPHKWPVTRKMFPFDDIIMYCWSCYQVTPWCQCPETVRWQIVSFVDFFLNRGFAFLVWHKWQFLNLLREKSFISTHLAKSYGRKLSTSYLTTEIPILLCEICWHEENYDRPITVTS